MKQPITIFSAALVVLTLGGCTVGEGGKTPPASQTAATTTTAQTQPMAVPMDSVAAAAARDSAAPDSAAKAKPKLPPPDLRLEVNVGDRKVYVYRNDHRIASYPVAVGTKEWPTRTGEWTIGQVIWNPRWIPPKEESWAEKEKVSEPGAEGNPLGRAQLVYDAPRSIHGTNAPESLGKAASHGSIRIANKNAIKLAKMVMEAGGAGKPASWYDEALANRTVRREVIIPNPVPIRVVNGDTAAAKKTHSGAE